MQIVDNSNYCLRCGYKQTLDGTFLDRSFVNKVMQREFIPQTIDEYITSIKSTLLNKLNDEYIRMLFNQAYHLIETNLVELPEFDYLSEFEKQADLVRLIDLSKFDDDRLSLSISTRIFSEILSENVDHYHSIIFSAIARLFAETINFKEVELALADINKAIDIRPNYAIGYFYRGYLVHRFSFYAKGEYETKVSSFFADYVKAIQLGSQFIADAYQIKGHKEHTIDFNSTLINYYPNEGRVYLQRGIDRFTRNTYDGNNHISFYRFNAQDYQDVLDDLRKAIKLSPELSEAYLYLAKTYSIVGIYRNEAKNDETGALSQLLDNFVGGDNEAIEAYSMHILHNPDSIDSYISRSEIYAFLRNYKAALEDIDEVLNRYKDNAWAYRLKANYLTWDKQYENAIEARSKLIILDSDLRHYWERGMLLLISNRLTEGMRDINHVLKLKIRAPHQYINTNQLFVIASLENAIYELSTSINKGNNAGILYSYRGLIKCMLERYLYEGSNAIDDCTKGIELDASNPQLYYFRAVVYLASNMDLEAIDDFTSYIMLSGGDCQVYFERSNLRQRSGDYQGAIADLNDSLMCNPKFMEGYVSLGDVYYYLKDYKNALSAYVNACQIDNNEDNYLVHQAKMSIKLINAMDLDDLSYQEN